MQDRSPPEFAIPDPDALQAETVTPSAPAAPEAAAGAVGAVLERQRDALMALAGVVMVGEGQDELGRAAIAVGVKQHHQLAALPRSVEGVRVMGIVIGEVDALGPPGAPR